MTGKIGFTYTINVISAISNILLYGYVVLSIMGQKKGSTGNIPELLGGVGYEVGCTRDVRHPHGCPMGKSIFSSVSKQRAAFPARGLRLPSQDHRTQSSDSVWTPRDPQDAHTGAHGGGHCGEHTATVATE